MGLFTFIVVIVAIGAGSSAITAVANALRPKFRSKDIEKIKDEVKRDLLTGSTTPAIPDMRDAIRRLEHLESQVTLQERQLEDLTEENSFLKRLIEKD
jgi:hypothetical protein